MKLQIKERQQEIKKEAKRVRREGSIPAVLYSKGQTNQAISILKDEFSAHLRNVPKGHLSSKVFSLTNEKGQTVQAIVKEIQYNPVTYDVIHVDFLQLHEGQYVNVNIPLSLKGAADCVGVKLGGVVRLVLRYMKVRCLPKDIPSHFEIDVTDLKMSQSRSLASIHLPDTVKPMMSLNDIAVVVGKR